MRLMADLEVVSHLLRLMALRTFVDCIAPLSFLHNSLSTDCAACEAGYASGLQYSCYRCHRSEKGAAIGGAVPTLVFALVVVTLMVAYLVRVVDHPTSERVGRWNKRLSDFRDGLVRAIPFTAIKIVVVAWQIITQVNV